MKITAILPIRGGSQRIKDKNIYLIKNKPLYEYILETILSSSLIDKIVINTDIQEIITKHKDNPKIVFIERDRSLRGNCSMNLVIEDTLDKIDAEHFIQVHATNPLLKIDTIEKGIHKYFDNLHLNDSVFSVTKVQKRFWDNKSEPVNHDPKSSPTTQDLEIWHEENSCFYIFSKESFLKNKNRIGDKPLLFETPLLESVDIDEEHDLKLFERLMT